MKLNILILLILTAISQPAFANVTYDTLAAAVESMEGNSQISIKKGVYDTKTGEVSVKWTVPKEIRASFNFRYASGTLQDGVIDFGKSNPTFVLIKNNAGLCARFLIEKVTVTAGYIDSDPNKTVILTRNNKECRTSYSTFQHDIERVFSPQPTASRLMKGEPFASIEHFCLEGTPNCFDHATPLPSSTSPVSYIEFNTIVPRRGQEQKALAIGLRPNQSVQLPNGAGTLTIGQNSGLELLSARYDVPNQKGSGVMRKVRFAIESGQLIFGNTHLNLPKGGKLIFENLDIQRERDEMIIRDGNFEGSLGEGSIIRLTSTAGKESFVHLRSAQATLGGLNMSFRGKSSSFSGANGRLNVVSKGGQLYLNDGLKLPLVPTTTNPSINLDLVLACPSESPVSCRPFLWSGDGTTVVKGTLSPLQVAVGSGGFIGFAGGNKLDIALGELRTDLLRIDTDDRVSPITGKNIGLQLKLASQNWIIDNATRLRAVEFSAETTNLEIAKGDPSPIGDLNVRATVSELVATGLATATFASAHADFKGTLSRDANGPVRLSNAELTGKLSAKGTTGDTVASTIAIKNLMLSDGNGSGELDLSIDSLTGSQSLSDFQEHLQGVPGGRFKINAEKVALGYSLESPIEIKGLKVKMKNNFWSLSDAKDIPINIALVVNPADPSRVIARAQHETGGGLLGGNYAQTSCKPEAKAADKKYYVRGKVDLLFEQKPRKAISKEFTLSEPIDISIDQSQCGAVALLTCGVVGGLLSGGNPVVIIAAGLACRKGVNDIKNGFEEDVRTKSIEFISTLNKELILD